jgi:adsorption protein B
LKQRTRWTMGIALQSWERHGWWTPQFYWFWRDRKGIIGNLISPLTNLLFLAGIVAWLPEVRHGRPWILSTGSGGALRWLSACTLALSVLHLSIRTGCAARIYGMPFACGVPLRAVLGNWLNCQATVLALWRYFLARASRRPLAWLKTEHRYPSRAALMVHKRRLGEILAARGAVDGLLLERALAHKPARERLGEYLIRIGVLRESTLYEALGVQQSLPVGLPDAHAIKMHATRSLPAAVSRRWKVLPFRVEAGELFIAGPELPSDEMTEDLYRFSRLTIRYHLVTPGYFERMAKAYLP